jgi:hypothetical protein
MLKSILTYLLLIGIPLAGLLWILDYGARLSAPPSIAGEWRIEGSLTGCLDAQPSALALQQSGRFVRVVLGEASGEARLDGDELHGSVVPPNGPCASVELVGRFDPAIERFIGQATGIGCDLCRGLEFEARRSGK